MGTPIELVLLASQKDEPPAPELHTPELHTPAALIEACRRGDRAALDEVFRAHAEGLERLLVRLVGPISEVEDLLQEAFAGAISAFPRFRGEASVKTWLHRIVVNVAQKHLRRPYRRHAPLPLDDVMAAPDPGAETEVARRELMARLYAHLDHLDARLRVALVLYVIEDMSIAEVAALMGASQTATKSRVFWARRALLRRLRRDPALADRRGDR